MKGSNGFVYKWVNKSNGKWYVGSHKGDKDDGYVGCGSIRTRNKIHHRHPNSVFPMALEKHGIDGFTRHILYSGHDYRKVEELCLGSHDAARNRMSYNATNKSAGVTFQTDESKEKLRIYQTGRINHVARKPIVQKSKDGVVVKEYDSITSAIEEGFDGGHVSKVCRGERKTHAGFCWEYKNNTI